MCRSDRDALLALCSVSNRRVVCMPAGTEQPHRKRFFVFLSGLSTSMRVEFLRVVVALMSERKNGALMRGGRLDFDVAV